MPFGPTSSLFSQTSDPKAPGLRVQAQAPGRVGVQAPPRPGPVPVGPPPPQAFRMPQGWDTMNADQQNEHLRAQGVGGGPAPAGPTGVQAPRSPAPAPGVRAPVVPQPNPAVSVAQPVQQPAAAQMAGGLTGQPMAGAAPPAYANEHDSRVLDALRRNAEYHERRQFHDGMTGRNLSLPHLADAHRQLAEYQRMLDFGPQQMAMAQAEMQSRLAQADEARAQADATRLFSQNPVLAAAVSSKDPALVAQAVEQQRLMSPPQPGVPAPQVSEANVGVALQSPRFAHLAPLGDPERVKSPQDFLRMAGSLDPSRAWMGRGSTENSLVKALLRQRFPGYMEEAPDSPNVGDYLQSWMPWNWGGQSVEQNVDDRNAIHSLLRGL